MPTKMVDCKETALEDVPRRGSNFISRRRQCAQKVVKYGGLSGVPVSSVDVGQKHVTQHNVDHPKIGSSYARVLLERSENVPAFHSNIPHAMRSSIRCSRQTQRYQTNRTETVETTLSAFERGTVQLRDSRRRTAEIMQKRRSQPALSEQMDELVLSSPSVHTATKVKFFNETKPTVMNKWIRAARTTSAYTNVAFEKSSNLAKHDIESCRLPTCELGKVDSHIVIKDQDQMFVKRRDNSAHEVASKACDSENRDVKHSQKEEFICMGKNCDEHKAEQSDLSDASSKLSPSSETFRGLLDKKEELLKSIPFADNKCESFDDKENIICRPIRNSDDSLSTGNVAQSLRISSANHRTNIRKFQDVGNLQLENSLNVNSNRSSSASRLRSFSVNNAQSNEIMRNRLENASAISKADQICGTCFCPNEYRSISLPPNLPRSSETAKRSRAWFVPLSKEERVPEVFYANNTVCFCLRNLPSRPNSDQHLLFGFRSAHDQSEHVGFGTRSSAIGGDRNAGDWLTWPSKTTHSASSKRAISTTVSTPTTQVESKIKYRKIHLFRHRHGHPIFLVKLGSDMNSFEILEFPVDRWTP
ncbi:hypothetical protein Tcan_12809 [Toxocara canis]|uniref:Uncharacterized protein n=1 Tax=Toxocara canis TaxID=6265 RepID=A0A0B2USS8_TOXCA|nr:hypothetical protein Tcan_12809 [Toxocara canis]